MSSPELAGGEALLQHQDAAVQQGGPRRAQAAGGVIERQGAIDAVARRGVRPGREAAHVALRPHVRDLRGLRQAGGAGGVDVERRVLCGEAVAGGLAGRAKRGHPLQRPIEVAVGGGRRRAADDPLGHLAADVAAHRVERRRGLAVDHHMRRAGNLQGMAEGGAGQVVVDQRRRHPDLGQAEPDGDVFQPVGHEEGDGVPLLDAPPGGPVGEAVGHGVELRIGQALGLEHDGGALRVLVDRRLEIVADQLGGLGRDSLQPPQGAQEASDEADFALAARDQTQAARFPHRRDLARRPGVGSSAALRLTRSGGVQSRREDAEPHCAPPPPSALPMAQAPIRADSIRIPEVRRAIAAAMDGKA